MLKGDDIMEELNEAIVKEISINGKKIILSYTKEDHYGLQHNLQEER